MNTSSLMKPESKLANLLIKQIKSPKAIALLLGIFVLLFLPPLISPHTAVYTTREIPPNQLRVCYSNSSSLDSVHSVAFVRKSINAIELDYDYRSSVWYSGHTTSDFIKHYNPLSPPNRDWVYMSDLDGNKRSEAIFVAFDNDSNLLNIADPHTMNIRRSIYIPIEGKVIYPNTRYFQSSIDQFLYISLVTKLSRIDAQTTFFRYDYVENSLTKLYQIASVAQSYVFSGYEDKLLFGVNNKHAFDFYTWDFNECLMDSFLIEKGKNETIKPAIVNAQTSHLKKESDLFILFDSDLQLRIIDLKVLYSEQAIKTRPVLNKSSSLPMRLKHANDDIIFYTQHNEEDEIFLFKYEADVDKLFRIKQFGGAKVGDVIFYGDIDDNGINDIVYTDVTKGKEAICVQQEGAFYDVLRYPISRNKLSIFNAVLCNNILMFYSKGLEHRIKDYQKNPNYYKLWFLYVGILVLFWFLGFVVQQIIENRAYRRQEASNRVLQLQLENIQKRIDPHFIFNSLNNLGSLILEGEANESYDYLSKVSGVLNKALRNRSVLISIEEELNFCTSVLDAQRQRFKDKFDYEVFIDKEIDLKWKMPSNILNSMVDNCIKHGFAGISYLGMISIELLRGDKGFLIVVEDNGKGREASRADKDQSKSTGTGLEICEQYVQLLNSNRKAPLLSFNIIDLWNADASSRGTRCEYFVPDDLS